MQAFLSPAMRASSGVVTSMITPPLSICARPTCSALAKVSGATPHSCDSCLFLLLATAPCFTGPQNTM